ncbi:hypothetical protein [Cytobacillus purgationiresistens]|uniref:YxeA family protein n=1 Tax=Cytobacillus purgationiresistens TaxID=863449 RepID=A0ABU0AKT0_9BACI|nr:hypothetical protein [Cytobacillus purgationiresistens]MDQ0271387.1 hypothetical protein [Cytobacillus purgationiresistens]
MTKKAFLIPISILLIFSIAFIGMILFRYESADDLYGFPIPRDAKITKQKEAFYEPDWWAASQEQKDGLPLTYRLRLKLDGWEMKERQGEWAAYVKEEKSLNVISTVDYLSVWHE